MEFECECDWDALKKILDEAPKESEGITYKGTKYIKEDYCISKSKVKEKIEEYEKAIKEQDYDKLKYSMVDTGIAIETLQELLEEE